MDEMSLPGSRALIEAEPASSTPKSHPAAGRKALTRFGLVAVVAGLVMATTIFARQWLPDGRSPEEVALSFARAVYARDYESAWQFIAAEDQQLKSEQDYLAENVSFAGLKQELAYQLASWIEFSEGETQITGRQATVTVQVRAPNGNQPEVSALLEAAERESESGAIQRKELFEQLESLYRGGQLEMLEGNQKFELIRERNRWRMVMGWDEAILVKHVAEVSPDLNWEFYPLEPEQLALPGETLTATYRVTNRTDHPVTAKAEHSILPAEFAKYMTTVQCFCLIQETLAPGETQDMTLSYRIDYGIPADVREFEIRYVFYPIESFPTE